VISDYPYYGHYAKKALTSVSILADDKFNPMDKVLRRFKIQALVELVVSWKKKFQSLKSDTAFMIE
jgi:hypothetical protein